MNARASVGRVMRFLHIIATCGINLHISDIIKVIKTASHVPYASTNSVSLLTCQSC